MTDYVNVAPRKNGYEPFDAEFGDGSNETHLTTRRLKHYPPSRRLTLRLRHVTPQNTRWAARVKMLFGSCVSRYAT